MGSALGVEKVAAARIGCSHAIWLQQRALGLRWCTRCKEWHAASVFGEDRTRGDGLAAHCLASRHTGNPIGWHGTPPINPATGRSGPAPYPPRHSDKKQARQRINVEVREGRRPHPNTLPCADCGHVWTKDGRRHEYIHHLGFAAEHHYDVISCCTSCSGARQAAARTHCRKGHEFTPENTRNVKRGNRRCRVCLTCRRAHDRRRHDAAYWQVWRSKRVKINGRWVLS